MATSRSTAARSSSSGRARRAALARCAVALLLLLTAAGCQRKRAEAPAGAPRLDAGNESRTPAERAKPAAPRTGRGAGQSAAALDPCAERLHALCGPLLFYYLQNRQLPPTLQDLEEGPEPIPPLFCPDSHKPYAYLPKGGIPIDNPPGYILVHDPVAAHNGVRWAIVISPGATAAEPLVAKAIGIREDRFAVLRSRSLTPPPEQGQERP